MSDNSFDKQFKNPKTRGEKEQINRIKKLSTDSSEILKVRKRLEQAGYGELKKEKTSAKDGPIIKSQAKKTPKRRSEDEPVFKKKGIGFFKSLFRILTKRAAFFAHHKKKLIKADLISLFKFGCGYVLDTEVIRFIREEVVIWQDLIKTIMNPLYKAGWRNSDGLKYLEPEEFNIIGFCARLANDRGILEVLYQPDNTKNIMHQTNTFIHYYYKILSADINKLINAFSRAMLVFRKEYPDFEIALKPDEYIEKIRDFFDSSFEDNFIVPLLSAVTGHNYSIEYARAEADIEPVEKDEYLADVHLKAKMKAREERYKKKVRHFVKKLKEEIMFLDNIKENLEVKYNLIKKAMNIIEISIFLNTYNSKKEPHIIRDLYAAIAFFNDYFAPFLFMSIKARKLGSAENVQLFDKTVFSKDYASILKLFEDVKSLVNNEIYAQCTKDVEKSNIEKIKCTGAINDICDFFYNIGEKISQVLNDSHQKRISHKPLDILQLETHQLQYPDYISLHKIKNNEKEKLFSVNGIKIIDVLKMIKTFCFCFMKYFESPYVLSDGKVMEKELLVNRLEKKKKYLEVLERLENGEEIKLPETIYDL